MASLLLVLPSGGSSTRTFREGTMALKQGTQAAPGTDAPVGGKGSARSVSRKQLIELLNEDLAREYQAIIAYVVYSQVLKGAEYMSIAAQLEIHAKQELDHALILSRH